MWLWCGTVIAEMIFELIRVCQLHRGASLFRVRGGGVDDHSIHGALHMRLVRSVSFAFGLEYLEIRIMTMRFDNSPVAPYAPKDFCQSWWWTCRRLDNIHLGDVPCHKDASTQIWLLRIVDAIVPRGMNQTSFHPIGPWQPSSCPIAQVISARLRYLCLSRRCYHSYYS